MKELPGMIRAFLLRDAAMAMSYRLDFLLRIVSILLSVLFIYFVARLVGENPDFDRYGGYLPFAIIGMTLLSYFQTGVRAFASAIRTEQMTGTLEAMLMTPAKVSAIVIASSVWSFLQATVTAVAVIATAAVLFEIPVKGSVLLAGAVLVLTILVFACLGVISASFVMVFKRGDPIAYFLGALSIVFGGVFFPVELLPSWMKTISYLLPITHGLDGLRGILLQGWGLPDIAPQISVLLGFACVGIPLSLFCFKKAVLRAQREGTLVQY